MEKKSIKNKTTNLEKEEKANKIHNQKMNCKNQIKQKELLAIRETACFGDQEFFIQSNYTKSVYDVILANLIVLTAVFAVMFVPIFSLALPVLVYIYLEIGLWGFVYNKEIGNQSRYEDLFVSIKKYIKIFCMAVVKIFLVAFWSLLLIVPGVICALNYSFTSLILYESPDLDVKGALMLSKELTHGYRWNILFWVLLSLTSVCVAMSLMFLILMIFDIFLVVSPIVYMIFVVAAGILDYVLMAMPMIELATTDYYIMAKSKKTINI